MCAHLPLTLKEKCQLSSFTHQHWHFNYFHFSADRQNTQTNISTGVTPHTTKTSTTVNSSLQFHSLTFLLNCFHLCTHWKFHYSNLKSNCQMLSAIALQLISRAFGSYTSENTLTALRAAAQIRTPIKHLGCKHFKMNNLFSFVSLLRSGTSMFNLYHILIRAELQWHIIILCYYSHTSTPLNTSKWNYTYHDSAYVYQVPNHSLWQMAVFHLLAHLAQWRRGKEWIRAKMSQSCRGHGWCRGAASLLKWSHQSLIIPFTQVRSSKLVSPLRCVHVCVFVFHSLICARVSRYEMFACTWVCVFVCRRS